MLGVILLKKMNHKLYEILEKLDTSKIFYTLGRYRDDVVTIHVTVPGARYEIEVESGGVVNTSIFKGSEDLIEGMEIVEKIIHENED